MNITHKKEMSYVIQAISEDFTKFYFFLFSAILC